MPYPPSGKPQPYSSQGTFTFHTSRSAAGPWTPRTVQIEYPCWGLNLTPSPAFHPNGTMIIAFHCDLSMCDVAFVSAPSWKGPFKKSGLSRIQVQVPPADGGFGVHPHAEDPFFWIAVNGEQVSWHVVLHNTPRGVHFFSSDGLTWKLQQKLDAKGNPQGPFFFDEHITYTDSTKVSVSRRERPWILFSESGAPRLLVTSMAGGRSDNQSGVWTMAQAVKGAK